MFIEINTDNYIEGKERMHAYFEGVINTSFKRFEDRITHIEVQLGDENSSSKKGSDDKRCMMEARVSGLKNVAVVSHADSIEKAINLAIPKLKNALEHAIGKVQNHH
jgi:ribosome-associated translation inhibitor RaiA